MKTTTKILLGMGSYILASISGIAIASASNRIVNQLVTPSVSMSPAQTILIASRDEQGEDRKDHEDDNDRENDNHQEAHTEHS